LRDSLAAFQALLTSVLMKTMVYLSLSHSVDQVTCQQMMTIWYVPVYSHLVPNVFVLASMVAVEISFWQPSKL
jgi:hypothetical protein